MSDPLLEGLAETVRALRGERGWSRRTLRERTDISERFLADIEAGRANPSILRLQTLARAFGIGVDQLLQRAAVRAGAPLPHKPHLALLGLRGAGKTSVGRELGHRLQVPFVELDERIEASAGLTLGEIFQVHGEPFYRQLERAALGAILADASPCVLATGGGIVTVEQTFATLRHHAHTVWLRARPEDHWLRVVAQGDTRPMADDDRAFQNLCAILDERGRLYGRAELTLDTSGRTVAELVDELALRYAFLGAGGENSPRAGPLN